MAISPAEKELDEGFKTAWQLKEKIKVGYFSKTGHIYSHSNGIQEEIIQFVNSNRAVVSRYIENRTTTEDIVLAQIMRQFLAIQKIIKSYEQPRTFFRTNPNDFITQLEDHLKRIEEELNKKLSSESEVKQEHQINHLHPRLN